MYKMYLISAEGYKNANVEFLTIKTTDEIWVNMKDILSGMGVKNISDLRYQVNEYKMIKREIYKRFTNLSKKELNTKNNKSPYARNDVMATILNDVEEKKQLMDLENN